MTPALPPIRRRRAMAMVAASCCGAGGLFSGLVPAAEGPAMTPQQVGDNAWFVQGAAALGTPANRNFISNAGFVVTDDGVVVIDALGAPALGEELLARIAGITRQPVRHLILTHYHADHIYGAQAFKARGTHITAHRLGQRYLNSETARLRLQAGRTELAPWIDDATQLVPADRWLDDDGMVLALGGERFHIVHVGPAHTPEDLAVYAERAGVMYCGDLVFRGRIPYVGQADSRRWVASLDRMIARRPAVLVPGHGAASTDPLADLQLTRDYLVHLRQTMEQAAANLDPFEEAYASADWSRFSHLPLFDAANRMNAYNTYLLLQQQDLQKARP